MNRTVPVPDSFDKDASQLNGVGGWLLFYCIAITIIGPLEWFLLPSQPAGSVFSLVVAYVAHARTVYGIFVGINVWKRKKTALTHVKVLLIWNFLLANLSLLRGFSQALSMLFPAAAIIGTFIWWMYFMNSKRVLLTFGRNI